jgi:hypothetical protein
MPRTPWYYQACLFFMPAPSRTPFARTQAAQNITQQVLPLLLLVQLLRKVRPAHKEKQTPAQ